MKKTILIPIFLMTLAILVTAKCGDNLCDIKDGEDCESCPDDCLCTLGIHNEKYDCCNDFSCQECELGYCHDRKCDDLEGFTSMFKELKCYENGSIFMKIEFLELKTLTLTPNEDLKVYMKKNDPEASFTEITGTWYNPSRTGDYRYIKIADISTFGSEADIFNNQGDYYVRVKYKIGMGNNIFQDELVSCPGVAGQTPPVDVPELPEEPVVDDVEVTDDTTTVEEPEVIAEGPQDDYSDDTQEVVLTPPVTGSFNWGIIIWVIVIVMVVIGLAIFFLIFDVHIKRKDEKESKIKSFIQEKHANIKEKMAPKVNKTPVSKPDIDKPEKKASVSEHKTRAISGVVKYIENNKAKGLDDLTIRNQLMDSGWTKKEIDRAFEIINNNT